MTDSATRISFASGGACAGEGALSTLLLTRDCSQSIAFDLPSTLKRSEWFVPVSDSVPQPERVIAWVPALATRASRSNWSHMRQPHLRRAVALAGSLCGLHLVAPQRRARASRGARGQGNALSLGLCFVSPVGGGRATPCLLPRLLSHAVKRFVSRRVVASSALEPSPLTSAPILFGGQWEGMADRRAARDDSTARGGARRGARGRESAGTAPALARVLVSAPSPPAAGVPAEGAEPEDGGCLREDPPGDAPSAVGGCATACDRQRHDCSHGQSDHTLSRSERGVFRCARVRPRLRRTGGTSGSTSAPAPGSTGLAEPLTGDKTSACARLDVVCEGAYRSPLTAATLAAGAPGRRSGRLRRPRTRGHAVGGEHDGHGRPGRRPPRWTRVARTPVTAEAPDKRHRVDNISIVFTTAACRPQPVSSATETMERIVISPARRMMR